MNTREKPIPWGLHSPLVMVVITANAIAPMVMSAPRIFVRNHVHITEKPMQVVPRSQPKMVAILAPVSKEPSHVPKKPVSPRGALTMVPCCPLVSKSWHPTVATYAGARKMGK